MPHSGSCITHFLLPFARGTEEGSGFVSYALGATRLHVHRLAESSGQEPAVVESTTIVVFLETFVRVAAAASSGVQGDVNMYGRLVMLSCGTLRGVHCIGFWH